MDVTLKYARFLKIRNMALYQKRTILIVSKFQYTQCIGSRPVKLKPISRGISSEWYETGSFRLWVVSAVSFRPGSFRPNFGVSRFSLFWWVVSAVSHFNRGSFRPMSGGYSTYVVLDPATSVYPIKNIRNIRHFQINI